MDLVAVPLTIPEGCNLILGQSHFIKTVEDLYEILVGAVPGVKFGLAFCEASGDCLVRVEGTDEKLRHVAADNALRRSHRWGIAQGNRKPRTHRSTQGVAAAPGLQAVMQSYARVARLCRSYGRSGASRPSQLAGRAL